MPGILSKRALISKANTTVVAVAAVAAFFSVFCLVSTKALVSQAVAQNKVISGKKQALKQLKQDSQAANQLAAAYTQFDGQATNAIGGSANGQGAKDGSNSKIILDALPSSYDFPALATSLEKILSNRGLKINGITGSDDEIAQQSNMSSATPTPVIMPFTASVSGSYASVQQLTQDMQNSIRPLQINSLNLSGEEDNMTADYTAQTYYQPGKVFNVSTKAAK